MGASVGRQTVGKRHTVGCQLGAAAEEAHSTHNKGVLHRDRLPRRHACETGHSLTHPWHHPWWCHAHWRGHLQEDTREQHKQQHHTNRVSSVDKRVCSKVVAHIKQCWYRVLHLMRSSARSIIPAQLVVHLTPGGGGMPGLGIMGAPGMPIGGGPVRRHSTAQHKHINTLQHN